ncbi:DUF4157 domain-containing protein [Ideonella sp. DXS29W]|uniref:DUF4157 domain-containing protein n=1 Tax=Ideonella lacteola TaxID=2984193 RepID=A0ABU9BWZ3_9BURK
MKTRTRNQRAGLSTPASEPASAAASSAARRFVDGSPHQLHQERRIAQLNAMAPPATSDGLPEQLTRGIAALSGEDLSDVRVHRASASPARLHAAAYAQGQDIHLAPGKERHLPHEAWHIVQQRQGRVRPTGQVAGQALNDDPRLEHEADAMGSKALQMRLPDLGEPRQLYAAHPSSSQASVVQAWAEEDWLIARLRGLDTVLRVYKGVPNEQILSELEELTDEIERKDWFKAAAVVVALREKYGIDQFPPPLLPIDAPEVVGGNFILESSLAIPLRDRPQSDLPPRPGSRRIELGAGDMASAATLGAKDDFTAYTEFRSEDDTRSEYHGRLDENIEKFKQTSNKTNTIKFGIDATQEGTYKDLPLTENLRFTNPNLGHDDIKERLRTIVLAPLDEEDDDRDELYLSSMGIGFWLDGKRLKQYKEKPPKDDWQFPLISSTANTIASVRNVFMLQQFLTNAPAKLIPGSGKVEIIVSASYLTSWPILKIASDMGYKAAVQNPYDLGFENVKTQKSEGVKKKQEAPAKKCLITLYLPWGGALFKTNSMSWVDKFTSVPSSLLIRVRAPD